MLKLVHPFPDISCVDREIPDHGPVQIDIYDTCACSGYNSCMDIFPGCFRHIVINDSFYSQKSLPHSICGILIAGVLPGNFILSLYSAFRYL